MDLLKECLPSVITAVGVYGGEVEILLIDNGSSDGSAEYVRGNFPGVKILSLAENFSSTKAMNKGIAAAKGEVVISLNNDVMVDDGFIAPLVSHFGKDKDVFAVGAKMLFWDRKTLNFGRATGDFRYGFFRRLIRDSADTVNSLYACSGGCAVDKDKFFELEGFDEDYWIYWEDFDLCYRAWRRGWKTVYEPQSVVYHRVHATNIKKYGQRGIDSLSGENYSLCIIKNIHNKRLLFKHILSLPLLILLTTLSGRLHFALGLLYSIKKWPFFWKKRNQEKNKAFLSDTEVLKISVLSPVCSKRKRT